MAFSILCVVDETTQESPLVPEPDEAPNSIFLEEGEEKILELEATALNVRGVRRPMNTLIRLTGVKEVKASVIITDRRVATACAKYDKGRTFMPLGGVASLGLAAVGTAVSKTRASHRRRGKTLVGHVRYPWVVTVGFKERAGPFTFDILRIGVNNPGEGMDTLFFEAVLAKGQSVREVAQMVVQEIATSRLENQKDLSATEREACEKLADAPLIDGAPKQFVSYVFSELPTEFGEIYNVPG